jgi:hypothetical protein
MGATAQRGAFNMPTISLPEMKRPDVKRPDVKLPEMNLPEFDLQDFVRDRRDDLAAAAGRVRDELSDLEMPRVDLPGIRDIRRSAANEIDPRPSRMPFLAGAAIVGVLVGWILAVSPVTGPRIRSAIGGLRDRFDAWRAGANDWDDADATEDSDSFADPMSTVMRTDPWIGQWANGTGTEPAETPVASGGPTEGTGDQRD